MASVPGYPVPRSQWVEKSDSCSTCGKKFSFFSSKTNCVCCGKLSCTECVQAECTITAGAPPSKVCLKCFAMVQDYRQSLARQSNRNDSLAAQAPTAGRGGTSSPHSSSVQPPPPATEGTPNRGSNADAPPVHPSGSKATTLSVDGEKMDIDTLLRRCKDLREENKRWLEASQVHEADVQAARRECEEAREELVASDRQLRNALQEQQVLQAEVNGLKAKLQNATKEHESLARRSAKELKAEQESHLASMEASAGRIRSLEESLQQEQRMAKEAIAQRAALEKAIDVAKQSSSGAANDAVHAAHLEAQVASLRSQLQDEREALQRERDRCTAVEADIAQLRAQLLQREAEARGAGAELAEVKAHAVEEEAAHLARLEDIESQRAAVAAEREQLYVEKQEVQQRIQELKVRSEDLGEQQQRLASAQAHLDAERTGLAQLDEKLKQIAMLQEEREHQHATNRDDIAKERSQLEVLRRETLSQKDSSNEAVQQLQGHIATRDAEIQRMRGELEQLEQSHHRKVAELVAAAEAERVAMETRRAEHDAALEAALASLREEAADLEARLRQQGEDHAAQLQRLNAKLSSDAAAAQAELSASAEEQLKSLDSANRETVSRMEEERLAHQQRCSALERDLGEANSVIVQLRADREHEAAAHANALRSVEEQQSVLVADVASKTAYIDRLLKQVDVQEQQLKAYADESERYTEMRMEELRKAKEELDQREATLLCHFTEFENSTAALAREEKALMEERQELQRDRAQLQKEREELEARLKSTERDALQILEDAAQRGALEASRIAEAQRSLSQRQEEVTRDLDERQRAVAEREERLARIFGDSRSPCRSPAGSSDAGRSRFPDDSIVPRLRVEGWRVSVSPLPPGVDLAAWDCDTIAVAGSLESVLQSFACDAAERWGLLGHVVPREKWENFVACVESNYLDNPYHNRVHAADVTQGTFSLVNACPQLLAHLTDLEKLAAITAAVIHDVRHPGRNAAYAEKKLDPVYLQYNGISVLEQMHLATTFSLLRIPALDFTERMTADEFIQFHKLVTFIVMGTDMATHKNRVQVWGKRLCGGEGEAEPYRFAVAADRQEVLALLCHSADVGACARPFAIAQKWLVVLDEFRLQGADERAANLPVSAGCEEGRDVNRDQVVFIDNVVAPLFQLVQQLSPALREPLEHLSHLRHHYLRKCSGSLPSPPSPSYTSPLASRVAELQEEVARCRRAEEQLARGFAELDAAKREFDEQNAEQQRRGAQLEELERLQNERSVAMAAREEALRDGDQRMAALQEKELQLKAMLREALDTKISSFAADETAHVQARLYAASSALNEREAAVRTREAELLFERRSLEEREARLTSLSESLTSAAKEVTAQKMAAQEIVAREHSVAERERAAEVAEAVARHGAVREVCLAEAEGRLLVGVEELDQLTAAARQFMREAEGQRRLALQCVARLKSIEEREARVSSAVLDSSRRRRIAAQGRLAAEAASGGAGPETPLGRLERAVFQLTAAVAQAAVPDRRG